jgi:hypothetical protein
MEKSDRPNLDPHTEAGLEGAQIGVDHLFWSQLRSLQVLTAWGRHKNKQENRPLGDAPPPAKQPAALRMSLVNYAHSLYNAEGNLYLEGPQIRYFLEQLRERIIDRVISMVEKVEEAGQAKNVSLKPHDVTEEDMRSTMRAALDSLIDKRLNPPPQPKTAAPPPPQVLTGGRGSMSPLLQMIEEERRRTLQAAAEPKTVGQRRKAFVDPLLENNGWSILDWANNAEVAHATAMDYLQGKTNPYRSTRKKLATALGISAERLPK